MLRTSSLAAKIDEYLSHKLPNETPAYLAMLSDRLADLYNRKISLSDAPAYLKSGGWSLDLVGYYEELLSELAKEKEQKETITMSSEDLNLTFTAGQVTQLLCTLTADFAEAADFRPQADGESGKEYREAFKQFLVNKRSSSLDNEVLDLMITQLTDVRETAAAHIAFYKELKK